MCDSVVLAGASLVYSAACTSHERVLMLLDLPDTQEELLICYDPVVVN